MRFLQGSASFSFSVILELIWTILEISANLMRKHVTLLPPPPLYDDLTPWLTFSFMMSVMKNKSQLHCSVVPLQALFP